MEQMNVPEEMKVEIDFTDPQIPDSVKTFHPLLFHDGDAFCCVLGPDPVSGILGYGQTSTKALRDWDLRLQHRIKTAADDEVTRFVLDTFNTSVNKIW
jgi:hypothetical protein